MGADLILSAVPACELTEDRRKALDAIVEGLADNDFPDFEDSIEAWRGRLNDALECYAEGERRDVSRIQLPGMAFPYLISGGMSWGDEPTDACSHFSDIVECNALWNELEEYARQDAAKAVGSQIGDRFGTEAQESFDREREYIASGGSKCPFCKSTNIEGCGERDFDGDHAYNGCECLACGKTWDDVYSLTGINEDDEDDDRNWDHPDEYADHDQDEDE